MSLYPFPIAHMQPPVADDAPPVAGYSQWWDVLRPGSLWQDSGRTVAAGVFDVVASWYDPTSGAAAVQAASSRQPLFTGSALEYDGADDFLVAAIGARGSVETIYIITQFLASAALTAIAIDSASALYHGIIYSAPGQPFLSAYLGTRLSNTTKPHGTRVAACVVFNGPSSIVRVGTVETTGQTAGFTPGTGLTIGAAFNGGDGLAAKSISAVVRYPAAHDATQRATVTAWLAARHGVTL